MQLSARNITLIVFIVTTKGIPPSGIIIRIRIIRKKSFRLERGRGDGFVVGVEAIIKVAFLPQSAVAYFCSHELHEDTWDQM